MIEDIGEIPFADSDDANIPVNIFIHAPKEPDNEDGKGTRWRMTADVFMPRKGFSDGAFEAIGDTREELVSLLEKHVLPLYEVAIGNIKGMIAGTCNKNYYWEKANG